MFWLGVICGAVVGFLAFGLIAASRDPYQDCEEGVIDGATFEGNPPGTIGLIVVVPERPVLGSDAKRVRLVPVDRY